MIRKMVMRMCSHFSWFASFTFPQVSLDLWTCLLHYGLSTSSPLLPQSNALGIGALQALMVSNNPNLGTCHIPMVTVCVECHIFCCIGLCINVDLIAFVSTGLCIHRCLSVGFLGGANGKRMSISLNSVGLAGALNQRYVTQVMMQTNL